ncbi:MAG: PilN domain-containing protein [Synechococcaceae cyanobacterium ELA445]
MSRPPRSLDLLRQRRLELGLPEIPAAPPDTSRLVLLGSLAGGALVLVSLLIWLGFRLRLQQLQADLVPLQDVPNQVNALQGQVKDSVAKVNSIKDINKRLVEGLVALRSGSALMAQLSLITPAGIQLTEASVKDESLSLKGVAADPQAFRRINALQLQIAGSPLFVPTGVAVVKVSRDTSKAAPPTPGAVVQPSVTFELTAKFAQAAKAASLDELKRLGAEGMAQRLLALRREGVLP